MRLGLRAQILFYLLLTLVVACGLFSVLALHLMQRALYHEWQKRWVTRAQEIAEDTRSLDRLAGRPSGRSIIRGEALIELSRTHPSLSEALQKVPRDHEKSPLVVWVRAGGNRLLIGRSRGPQREPFALVSDFPRFRNETRSVRLLVIGYLGFATLLALLVGVFLLQRSVVKPVDQMLSTISRLSVAVMERPISLDLTNNLQVLNRSIETMAETLRDKQERIQKHLEHLKRVNEELARTQDSLVLSEKLASVGQLAAG
ncbi:MAG: methyl-accepting chemotaxis protein, partial [Myxococcales bacterium]|nr:methyl-accepting chemotaxis protein [Myxococcales bacterium]